MPPCPSIRCPQSFTPRSRLMADITSPPRKPVIVIRKENAAACQGWKGVIHHRAVPNAVADTTPPKKPSTVFDGDTFGAILCRPASLPQTYCSTSLDWATRITNTISIAGSQPGIVNINKAGTCEMQYTQIIKPH